MTVNPVLEQIRGGLIVSCQALESDPMFGNGIMAKMATAAKEGGAIGIRANGYDDIKSIKEATKLPVIGIVKRSYEGSPVYITPTLREVEEVIKGGAEILALDATKNLRPSGILSGDFIQTVKKSYPEMILMADVSTFDEGRMAAEAGADIVATTMAGYTEYSVHQNGPNFKLISRMVRELSVPVIAEGKIRNPADAVKCFELGTFAVVVGAAITKPQEITRTFVEEIKAHPLLLAGE